MFFFLLNFHQNISSLLLVEPVRNGPFRKVMVGGENTKKIHVREGDRKKRTVQRRSEKKKIPAAENCIAAENFRTATLYSSRLGPCGIPIPLIISTIRKRDIFLFSG